MSNTTKNGKELEWQQRLLRKNYCPETKNEGRRNTSGRESKSKCQCPEVERLCVFKKMTGTHKAVAQ